MLMMKIEVYCTCACVCLMMGQLSCNATQGFVKHRINIPGRGSVHTNVLEPQRPTVLPVQPLLAVGEAACGAPLALGVVGAVEKGDMLVANVAEPVDLALILKQTESDTVHRRITPALVEEASSTVEVVEVLAVLLAAPEAQVADLEVRPEMARRIAVRLLVVLRPPLAIFEPFARIVGVYVVWMVVEELLRLRPQCRDTLGTIVDVDVEAVGLVVILHPCKDIVVDIAEEVDVRFDPPVVLHTFQCWMLAKHAAIPSAHLMV